MGWGGIFAFRVGVSNFGFTTFWVWGSGLRDWGVCVAINFLGLAVAFLTFWEDWGKNFKNSVLSMEKRHLGVLF